MVSLNIFVAVVESDGVTAAAEALGMTVTATSRHVKALEQRLGVRLLHRTTRRIRLTEAGQVYFDQARRILAELRETEEQLAQLANEPQGQLRVTAPMSFGLRRLAPLVARFARPPETAGSAATRRPDRRYRRAVLRPGPAYRLYARFQPGS